MESSLFGKPHLLAILSRQMLQEFSAGTTIVGNRIEVPNWSENDDVTFIALRRLFGAYREGNTTVVVPEDTLTVLKVVQFPGATRYMKSGRTLLY
jgi:hypothetical protein